MLFSGFNFLNSDVYNLFGLEFDHFNSCAQSGFLLHLYFKYIHHIVYFKLNIINKFFEIFLFFFFKNQEKY